MKSIKNVCITKFGKDLLGYVFEKESFSKTKIPEFLPLTVNFGEEIVGKVGNIIIKDDGIYGDVHFKKKYTNTVALTIIKFSNNQPLELDSCSFIMDGKHADKELNKNLEKK